MAANKKSSSPLDEFDIGLLFHIFQKSVIYIILFFLIAMMSALLYIRYQREIFKSSAVIQITNNSGNTKLLDVGKVLDTENGLDGVVELMRSKVFLRKSIAQLPIKVSYFVKGTFKVNEHYKTSPYEIIDYNVKNIGFYGKSIFLKFKSQDAIEVSYIMNENRQVKIVKPNTLVKFPDAEFKVVINNFSAIQDYQTNLKKDVFFFVINDPVTMADVYINKLEITVLNYYAKTLRISIEEHNAKKTADIVNQIASDFINYDVIKKSESAQKTIDFIDKQLSFVSEDLRGYEQKIQNFRKETKTTASHDFSAALYGKYDYFQKELLNLNFQMSVITDMKQQYNSTDVFDVSNLLFIGTGSKAESFIVSKVGIIDQLLLKKAKYVKEATYTNKVVQEVENSIKIEKKELFEGLIIMEENYKGKILDLEEQIANVESQIEGIPAMEIEFNRLEQLYKINETFYNSLLNRKAEYSIAIAGFVPQNAILEQALEPSLPIYPNRNTILLTAIGIASILSIVMVAIRFLLFNNITTVNEIKKYTNMAILGIVPKYKKEIPVSQLLVDKNPKSSISEAFRSIRANLQFISNESGAKVVAITSSISGEGKTFVAINLAGIIAFAGKKVIVLDLDMRKPKIHIGFDAPNTHGMSTILIGKDNFEDCIQKSSLPNLQFITAGPIPPNPAELIISQRMDETIEVLKKMYDIIIIDNPPIGIVSDGIPNIQKSDYPILFLEQIILKKHFLITLIL
jgi:tyrosine-protein kinase Etk/Wzc